LYIKEKEYEILPGSYQRACRDCYLKKVVKKLKPGKIIPIHTFHPDKYGGLFSRKIVQVSDGEVFVV